VCLCRQVAKKEDNSILIRFPIGERHSRRVRVDGNKFWRYVKDLSKKIYVGNLSFDATEEQVSEMFTQFGKVESIAMITDRDSGRFRGFGFVEMEDSAANAAIKALNDTELDGRTLRVNEARPREERRGAGQKKGKFPYSGGGNY
jgi:cold-inducible RNA-binding protein